MIGSMIGTIANIVLDPIFISVLDQGTAGAAIATTIGNMLASAYYVWYFLRKSRILSLHWKDFKCGDGILVRTCSTGLPTAIFSALMLYCGRNPGDGPVLCIERTHHPPVYR